MSWLSDYYDSAALKGGDDFSDFATGRPNRKFYDSAALDGGFKMPPKVRNVKVGEKSLESVGKSVYQNVEKNLSATTKASLHKHGSTSQIYTAFGISYYMDAYRRKMDFYRARGNTEKVKNEQKKILRMGRFLKDNPEVCAIYRIVKRTLHGTKKARKGMTQKEALKIIRNRQPYGISPALSFVGRNSKLMKSLLETKKKKGKGGKKKKTTKGGAVIGKGTVGFDNPFY